MSRKVGMRIVKSCIAAYLCFVVYMLRGQKGIPFYSVIASIFCMQPLLSRSLKVAGERMKGTIIGVAVGIFTLCLERQFHLDEHLWIHYLLLAVMYLPVLYLTVITHNPASSFIACVAYSSVTVSHGFDVSPFSWGINRLIDTMIGILVAYVVNCIHMPARGKRDHLYAVAVDALPEGEDGVLDNYTKVRLNQLVERGAHIFLYARGSAAEAERKLAGYTHRFPVYILNGAALYDPKKGTFTAVESFSEKAVGKLGNLLEKNGFSVFTYCVSHGNLQVFFDKLEDEAMEKWHDSRSTLPRENYVCAYRPADCSVQCLRVFVKEEQRASFADALQREGADILANIHWEADDACPGWQILSLYPLAASVDQAAGKLMEELHVHELNYYVPEDQETWNVWVFEQWHKKQMKKC